MCASTCQVAAANTSGRAVRSTSLGLRNVVFFELSHIACSLKFYFGDALPLLSDSFFPGYLASKEIAC